MTPGTIDSTADRAAGKETAACSGIHRTGRRTRILLGTPTAAPSDGHLQIFTWFTDGRDWVRIEIRHATDSGIMIQTAVKDTEMDPRAALSMGTELASRFGIPMVYFHDGRPVDAASASHGCGSWQVCIR